MEGGNTSRIVVWLDDTVIVKKATRKVRRTTSSPTRGPVRAFPAPVSISSAGAWCKPAGEERGEYRVETKTHTQRADADGQLQIPSPELEQQSGNYQWVITAATPEGRLAHLGFTSDLVLRTTLRTPV